MIPRFRPVLLAGLLLLGALPAQGQEAAPFPSDPGTSPGLDAAPRAQIMPRRHTVLAAEMAGRIIRMPVREGASFDQGELLFAFDCSVERARLEKAEAALTVARKKADVQARLQRLGSSSELEAAVALAEVEEAQAERAVRRAQVRRCRTVAPFSGRISDLKVQNHQSVKRGEPIMEIVDSDTLELELIVPSEWLAWLERGQAFPVKVDETGTTHRAEVTLIAPWIDAASQSVTVYAHFQGGTDDLRPGMSGRALLERPDTAQ